MSIDVKIINLKKAMRENRDKDIVQYKFTQYLREYEALGEKDVIDKQTHRDLTNEFLRYISKSGEDKR